MFLTNDELVYMTIRIVISSLIMILSQLVQSLSIGSVNVLSLFETAFFVASAVPFVSKKYSPGNRFTDALIYFSAAMIYGVYRVYADTSIKSISNQFETQKSQNYAFNLGTDSYYIEQGIHGYIFGSISDGRVQQCSSVCLNGTDWIDDY